MAGSAMLLFLASLAAPAGAAEPLTAEAALGHYRELFEPVALLDCPRPSSPDEIIVCGRPEGTPDPNRLPVPYGREPGAPVRGEAPSTIAAMNADSCLRLCYQPVMVNLVTAAKTARKIVEHLLDPD